MVQSYLCDAARRGFEEVEFGMAQRESGSEGLLAVISSPDQASACTSLARTAWIRGVEVSLRLCFP